MSLDVIPSGGLSIYFLRNSSFMIAVKFGFDLFKRRSDDRFHFIQESSTESIAKKGVVKVFDMAPETIIAEAALRDQAVDMRIPFKIPAKGMQDHNETESKVFGMIHLGKHTGNNTVERMEKTVE